MLKMAGKKMFSQKANNFRESNVPLVENQKLVQNNESQVTMQILECNEVTSLTLLQNDCITEKSFDETFTVDEQYYAIDVCEIVILKLHPKFYQIRLILRYFITYPILLMEVNQLL